MSEAEPTRAELAQFELRMVIERMQFRIDTMNDYGRETVGISGHFAKEIVETCRRAIKALDHESL